MNETGKGAQCNKAIMLITDGAPDYYEKIFARYKRLLNFRVFTFLIGREVARGDEKQVKSMACANKGIASYGWSTNVLYNFQTHVKLLYFID